MTELHVNVHAEDYGWLFEDLKRHFTGAARPGLRITASTAPLPRADRWISLRTSETGRTPDAARTVACIHDFYDDPDLYAPAGARHGVRQAGALWLCHPGVRTLLDRDGVEIGERPVLERPIGALAAFGPREDRAPCFTIGWIGRNDPVKRLPDFIEALAQAASLFPFEVRLIGEDLQPMARAVAALGPTVHHHDRRRLPIEDCPPLYRQMDALVITSASEGQPMVLFEALACGVAVVSSAVGWAPRLAALAPRFVRLAQGPKAVAMALAELHCERDALFEQRHAMAGLVSGWRLDGWIDDMLRLATELPTPRPR